MGWRRGDDGMDSGAGVMVQGGVKQLKIACIHFVGHASLIQVCKNKQKYAGRVFSYMSIYIIVYLPLHFFITLALFSTVG
jgi:hypothetical protein